MKEAEKILEKFARKNMIEWNQESFKRTHSRLHKSIVEAINEALTIPVVSSRLIDKVTVTNLDLALRMCGISFDKNTIDKIIDRKQGR